MAPDSLSIPHAALAAARTAVRAHGQTAPRSAARNLTRLRRRPSPDRARTNQHDQPAHTAPSEEHRTDASGTIPPLQYTAPTGETGMAQVGAPSRQHALVHLFAFEQQHAAAHRRRLQAEGIPPTEVLTDLRFKHGADGQGDLVPVGAATETRADRNEDGIL